MSLRPAENEEASGLCSLSSLNKGELTNKERKGLMKRRTFVEMVETIRTETD